MKKEEKSLLDEFREYAIETKTMNQFPFAGDAPVFTVWLLKNIKRITEEVRYTELAAVYSYYGYTREMAIAMFDFANSDSTVDWKRTEISEYAAFIIQHFTNIKVKGKGFSMFPYFPIDTIVVSHMPMFIAEYPWDDVVWPTPGQLSIMVDMYQNMNVGIEITGEKSSGLWEWILQYGERSPIPTYIITRAMQDAIDSGNANTVAEYISPAFLEMQPLVASNGDDTGLANVWDIFITAIEVSGSYPDELMSWYGQGIDKAITFEDLYKLIYDHIKKTMQKNVDSFKQILVTQGPVGIAKDHKPLLALYRTIIANGDCKIFGLEKAADVIF